MKIWKSFLEDSRVAESLVLGLCGSWPDSRFRSPQRVFRVAPTCRRLLSACRRPLGLSGAQTCQKTARLRHPRPAEVFDRWAGSDARRSSRSDFRISPIRHATQKPPGAVKGTWITEEAQSPNTMESALHACFCQPFEIISGQKSSSTPADGPRCKARRGGPGRLRPRR